MVDVVDSQTGEIHEAESIEQAAAEIIERPPYWRSFSHGHFVEEGEWGIEFDRAFLKVQTEIGPLVEADAENPFQKNKYASLGGWLVKVQPSLNRHGFIVNQGAGRINSKTDLRVIFLPVWFKLTHVETGQWKRVFIEEPISKVDPQGISIALTYGRRAAGSAFMSTKDADPDGVLLQAGVDHEKLAEALSILLDKIHACNTETELKAWSKKNEQQFDNFAEEDLKSLRRAWQERLNVVKAPAAKEKKEAANGK